MNETVAAVVVTFNRKMLLVECVTGLLKQSRPVDAIVIIDNASTDGTAEHLVSTGLLPQSSSLSGETIEVSCQVASRTIGGKNVNVSYLRLRENTGGAGGFYHGVKNAYERGCDWLWLMDDDAEPYADALEVLLRFGGAQNIAALAQLKLSLDQGALFQHRGFFCFDDFFPNIVRPIGPADIAGKDSLEIDHASFVGILVSRKAVEKIGLPKKEFFIHYDDVEYCARLRSVGKIILVPESKIVHKEPGNVNRVMKKVLWMHYEMVPFDKLWIRYFHARNLVWLKRRYSSNTVKFYFGLILYVAGGTLAAVLFQDHKIRRAKFLISRCVDGLTNTFDNMKPRRILEGK